MTVSPAKLSPASTVCASASGGYSCTVKVAETKTSQGRLNWSASGSITGVTFSPASGSLTPGKNVSVTIGSLPCSRSGASGSFTFSGAEGETPVTVTWHCKATTSPATLVVTPTSLDPTNAACGVSGSIVQCTVTLSETVTSTVNANWVATTTFSDSAVVPASGTLTPGSSTQVVLDSLPCQNGSVTFTGSEGEAPVTVTFSCTPNSLSASPAQLDPTNAACSASGSTYVCAMTLAETAGSPGNITWTTSSDLNGVTFSPSSGTLSPGQSITVNVTGIPCQNGSFFFNGPPFGTLDAIATWSCSPPPPSPVLTVTPTSLDPTSAACTGGTANPQCTVTLGETVGSQGLVNWSASSDLSGVTFSPSNSFLSPGGSTPIIIPSIPCQNGTFTFSGAEGETPVTIAWSCTPPPPPPTLTVTPTSLDPSNAACSGSYPTYQCTLTLGETAASVGNANWSVASDVSGASFSSSSGSLTPGGSVSIFISSIPCQNGSFTFSGAEGESAVVVAWSCSPPSPVLTVDTTSLDQGSSNCMSGASSTCSITLGETANSQENVNWTATSASPVTFSPSAGTLSPGKKVVVTITNIPCQNETFSFGPSFIPVNVSWSCNPGDIVLINPTNMSHSSNNCSLNLFTLTYTCSVTIMSNYGYIVYWEVTTTTSGLTISPSSGSLSPGQSVTVTISNIPTNTPVQLVITASAGNPQQFFVNWTG